MRASAFAGALALLVLVSNGAAAQDDTERARALFTEGLELADRGEWQEAAVKFRATLRLRQSPAVVYNLAVALEHTGAFAEASELLETVIEDPTAERAMVRDARRLHRSIQPRLARVTIQLESDLAGATIRIGDEEVAGDRIGQPIPVDPGTHAVVLMRGSRVVERQQVSVVEGASETVTLGRGDTGGGGGGAPTAEETAELSGLEEERPPGLEEEEDEGEGGSVFGKWWFWTAVGAVAVVAVGGVVIATSGEGDPVPGNLMPGVLEVEVQ